jgi:hypothetical protein
MWEASLRYCFSRPSVFWETNNAKQGADDYSFQLGHFYFVQPLRFLRLLLAQQKHFRRTRKLCSVREPKHVSVLVGPSNLAVLQVTSSILATSLPKILMKRLLVTNKNSSIFSFNILGWSSVDIGSPTIPLFQNRT